MLKYEICFENVSINSMFCSYLVVPGQELNEAPLTLAATMAQTSSTASSTCAPTTSNTIPNPNPNPSPIPMAMASANAIDVEVNVAQALPTVSSVAQDNSAPISVAQVPLAAGTLINARPGSMVRVPEMANGSKSPYHCFLKSNRIVSMNSFFNLGSVVYSHYRQRDDIDALRDEFGQREEFNLQRDSSFNSINNASTSRHSGHSRNSSWDLRSSTYNGNAASRNAQGWNATAHSRNASLDLRHSRNSSADLNKIIRNDVGLVFNPHQQSAGFYDPLRIQIIKAHHNWISAAYPHFVTCYRLKDSSGWQLVFTSPYIDATIERLAIKVNFSNANEKTQSKMVAISYGSQIRLWRVSDDGNKSDVGIFNLNVRVEYLFFIGNQLVALSSSGKIGVWHAMTQHFQIQDLCPILSFDTAGSFLLLGCNNGSIYYIGIN